MATQTQYKGYATQTTGSAIGTWGDVLNASMITPADLNLGGIVSKALVASNVTLSDSEAQRAMLRLTGNISAALIVTSSAQGFYLVENLTTGAGTVFLTNGIGGMLVPQSYRCIIYADINNGVRIYGAASITNPDVLPLGTQMFFFNGAAPSGWTLVTTNNDYALSLSSTTGAITSGSLGYTTVYGRTTTDGHVLTNAEAPAHTHGMTIDAIGPNGGLNTVPHWQGRPASDAGPATGTTDTMTSGGDAHTHGLDMRVFTATTIICSRAN